MKEINEEALRKMNIEDLKQFCMNPKTFHRISHHKAFFVLVERLETLESDNKRIKERNKEMEDKVTVLEIDKIGADSLAYWCAKCIQRGHLDSRSAIGDALLNYLRIGGVSHPNNPLPESVPDFMEKYEAQQLQSKLESLPANAEEVCERYCECGGEGCYWCKR